MRHSHKLVSGSSNLSGPIMKFTRKMTQAIVFRAINIDRACYMLTDKQWEELDKIKKILGEIDNDIQARA